MYICIYVYIYSVLYHILLYCTHAKEGTLVKISIICELRSQTARNTELKL